MRIGEYGPERRADAANLLGRVWGSAPTVEELTWFYEQNPVRKASVLLGEEDDRVVGLVVMSFVRMLVAGDELEVGMPIHLATDPEFRGRGIFAELQSHNEDRARELGIRMLLIVPNAASAPILTGRLGWKPLAPLRLWARAKLRSGRVHATEVSRFERDVATGPAHSDRDAASARVLRGESARVLRDDRWLNWRFEDAPKRYRTLERQGLRGGRAPGPRRGGGGGRG